MKNVALITGASSGIGRVLARIHASEGGDLRKHHRDHLLSECHRNEIAGTGNLENTLLFKRKVRSADTVAARGYRNMKKGRSVVVDPPLMGFVLKFLMHLFPCRWIVQASRMVMEPAG